MPCTSGSSKAKRPMNSDIVNPMPHKSTVPAIYPQLAWVGKSAWSSLTRIATVPRTPISLPSTSPAATPMVSGSAKITGEIPLKETPALANPKLGTIRKATGL